MIVKDEITQHIALLIYKKVTDSETRTITFLDSMNLSASSFYCKTVKDGKEKWHHDGYCHIFCLIIPPHIRKRVV